MNLALVSTFVFSAATLGAQQASYRVPMPPNAGWFGSSMVVMPDIDRDGVPDIAVGAPHSSSGSQQTGAVYLYSGRTGTLLRTILGEYSGGRFGYALDTIPDVNGDGIADLIASSPSSYDLTITVPGYVRIISPVDGSLISETPRRLMTLLGYSLSTFRDVDNDGAVDFIATHQDRNGVAHSVQAYSARTGAYLGTIFNGAPTTFSTQLHARTDFDLDGVPDVVIGDFEHQNSCQPAAGRVMVLSGVNSALWWQRVGYCGQRLGMLVASIPDRNGDRVPEVVSDGSVFSGLNGMNLSGGGAIAPGIFVAEVGDVDRDGFSDTGGARGSPIASIVSRNGTRLADFTAHLSVVEYAAWGDLNGDGLKDLVVAGDGLSVHVTRVPRAGATPFGTGCPGLFGTPTLTAQGTPTPGSRLTLRVDGIRPMMPGAMVIGVSRTSIRGIPLPFDLGTIGMLGCSIYVSDELVLGMLSANQYWSFNIDVPVDLLILGTSVYVQHFHIDPSANVRGLVASNGMQVLVGH